VLTEHNAYRCGSIERERKACMKRSFSPAGPGIANATATCKRMRRRRCGEQITRVHEDMVKKMQHDTTRSYELLSKVSMVRGVVSEVIQKRCMLQCFARQFRVCCQK
jgi:hypothetical protein